MPGSQSRSRVGRVFATILALLGPLAPISGGPGDAWAHEVRPGYLEITALGGQVWDLLWKVPARGDLRLALNVGVPEGCQGTEPRARIVGGAHVQRWRVTCPNGLVGRSISIGGLVDTRTDVLARVKHLDGTTQTVRLTPGRPGFTVEGSPGALETAVSYLGLGVEHILLGVDHLLFVLALLLLVGNVRKLVGAITAFTAAHSLTLGAATLGWLYLPSAPIEAAIALSIVFLAAEVVRDSEGLAARRPWLVAFVFGLLHGFGFARALSEIGLPGHAIPVALAFFNIGVEAGQLLFVAGALCVFRLAGASPRFGRHVGESAVWAGARRLAHPAAYSVGILGAFWLIARTASFWDVP